MPKLNWCLSPETNSELEADYSVWSPRVGKRQYDSVWESCHASLGTMLRSGWFVYSLNGLTLPSSVCGGGTADHWSDSKVEACARAAGLTRTFPIQSFPFNQAGCPVFFEHYLQLPVVRHKTVGEGSRIGKL